MNNEYLKMVHEALNKKIQLTQSNSKSLKKLYEEVAEDLLKKASKSKGFNKAWMNDYSKVVKNRLKSLENDMFTLNKESLSTSSQIAAAVQASFFEYIEEKFELDIPKELYKSIYTIPEDIVLKLLSGELYKDGKGLAIRIWSSTNKLNTDINYILAKGIAGNKSYQDIIKDLERYVDPGAKKPWEWNKVYPGVNKQVDYNAQRLLRTGVNHAFYLSSMESNKRNPYVEAVHWELSGQHFQRQVKRFGRDECDDYAEQNRYNLGQGNFPKDDVPIPHVQCLCSQYGVVSKSMEEIGRELGDWLAGGSNPMLDEWYSTNGTNSLLKEKNNTFRGLAVSKEENSGIIKERNMAYGLRTTPSHILTKDEIKSLKDDISAIKADEKVFIFNKGNNTAYNDRLDIIKVKGDVLPDLSSQHPRDLMSSRAVLAHEYYGHRAFRNTTAKKGSWNDEFRASYMAAKNCPNLSDEDRMYLILDSIERAKEAGVTIKYNNFMRRILYGY